MSCALTPGVSITCAGTDWGTTIAAGYALTVGLTVTATAVPAPPAITVR
jgi:hypothetical protein